MEQQTTQVLVVDDNPEIRDIIHVLLEGEGIRVTEAADGSSALHFLEKGSFDLIILDIMMPGLNGYETCQKIRQLTNVPILFLVPELLTAINLWAFPAAGTITLQNPFPIRNFSDAPEHSFAVTAFIRENPRLPDSQHPIC